MKRTEIITADGTVDTLVQMLKNIGVEYIDRPVAREIIKANLEAAALAGAKAMQAEIMANVDSADIVYGALVEALDPATIAREALQSTQ